MCDELNTAPIPYLPTHPSGEGAGEFGSEDKLGKKVGVMERCFKF